MEKMIKTDIIRNINIYDLEGTIPEIIDFLEEIQEKESGDYSNVRLRVDSWYDDVNYELIGDRVETDVEYEKRMAEEHEKLIKKKNAAIKKAEAAKRAAAAADEEERQLYYKLHEKYGA